MKYKQKTNICTTPDIYLCVLRQQYTCMLVHACMYAYSSTYVPWMHLQGYLIFICVVAAVHVHPWYMHVRVSAAYLYSSTHACMRMDVRIYDTSNPSQHAPQPLCCYSCTGGASDPNVTSTLRTHESSRWLTRTEVENDPKLNLHARVIGTFYAHHMRFGNQSRQTISETT